MYGVNIDESMEMNEFEYLIADGFLEEKGIPEGCVTRTIPKFNWAIFPCRGPMPKSMQDTQNKIFSEWLPNCKDYEIAAGYNIEMYDIPCNYPNGINDENYYCEIWIPVKKKQN